MKIALITYDNFPFGGAPANLLRYFALAVARENNEVEVILPTGNYYGNKIDINTKRNGNIENIRYKHLCFKIHPKNLIGKFVDNICSLILPIFYLIQANHKKKIDKIILYNANFFGVLASLFIKIAIRTKLIIIIPEFYEKPKSRFISLSLIRWYNFYFGLKYLSKYASSFIVLSNFLRNYLVNTLKVNKPILILPNLMDPNNFNVTGNKPFINNKITIGYAGTPTRKDGVMDLIESFGILNKKNPDTHLLIIGDVIFSNSILPQLKDRAMKLGINENITFTGLVSFSKIPELLNACQILALTRPNGISAEAGFPTKLGEYFACRKPVVITRVGDIPLYFKNGEHVIIVNPGDINSIMNGFEKLINDKGLSERLCNNAYDWMDANLNYKNMSKKLCEFIAK